MFLSIYSDRSKVFAKKASELPVYILSKRMLAGQNRNKRLHADAIIKYLHAHQIHATRPKLWNARDHSPQRKRPSLQST